MVYRNKGVLKGLKIALFELDKMKCEDCRYKEKNVLNNAYCPRDVKNCLKKE